MTDTQAIAELLAERDALRAELAALKAQEPVAWHVVDERGDLMHAASWKEAAHEHISDAISEHDLIEAARWRVVPVYAAPTAPAETPVQHKDGE